MDISLAKLPWYGQIAAFVALAGAAGTVYFAFYELPAQVEQRLQEGRLKALRNEIEKARATAKKLPDLRTQIEDGEDQLKSLRAVVPEEKDAAELFRRMQTVATESGLTIKSYKPAPMVTRQFHAEWPIALVLDGTYHNLATFFDRVGKFAPMVTVTELDVRAKDQPASNSTLTASCIATSFVLLGKAAATKPAARQLPPLLPADKST